MKMLKSLRPHFPLLGVAAVMVFLLAACGGAAAPAKPVDVQINLSEFKVESSLTTFSINVPYHFTIKNTGKVAHDWMIMPPGSLDESKALIIVEDEDLPPGAIIIRDFTFTQAGNFEFACHVVGHYEAGMKEPITVK
jgi:uncharacterized cupredoxin-like copper-binding protein